MTDTSSTSAAGASESQPAKKRTWGPCRQLETAKVTWVTNSRINIGYDERHRAAPTADQHSSLAHDIGHVVRTHCPIKLKSWKAMLDEMWIAVRSQLSDLDDEMLAYITRLFAERQKQWKSDLHHHFYTYDDPHVALQEGCPKELEGQKDSWEWLCSHFQEADFVKQAKANKGNRAKKTLLHHSGSRPFSYRMEERRWIDVFGDVYVRPGNELAESLHTMMMEKSQLVLQESASQLPPNTPLEYVDPPKDVGFQILTETLDQTLWTRPGTYCRGMGNARRQEPRPRSSSQATSQATVALTAKVTMLETQMAQMTQFPKSLAQAGLPIWPFTPSSTSEPIQPEHGHHTSAPSDNAQPSMLHSLEDRFDFGNLFN
ncbi:unnamed protein product [Prunus armeniaca]